MGFKKGIYLIIALFFLTIVPLFSQEIAGNFKNEIKTDIEVNYIIKLPENQKEKFPLLVFLHGSGERGSDLELVKNHSPFTYQNLMKTDVALLAPQCPANTWWNTNAIYELIQSICKQYNIDKSRIYLTGLSMGGWGTWKLATEHPELFAAVAPVCGVTDTNIFRNIEVLKNTPVHIFHGALDDIVSPNRSIDIYQKLRKVNPNCSLSIFPNDNHNSWDSAYSDPKFYEWLFAQKKE
jgi:predicted peptidase